MPRPRVFFSLFLLAGLPLAAAGQSGIRLERSFPASNETTLELRNLSGQVEVFAWEEPQVRVVATRRSPAVETHLEQSDNRLHVHTHLLQSSAPASDRVVDYVVWAPMGSSLQLRQETGTLLVESFRNDVLVETVAASVVVRNLSGPTTIKTFNGTVEAVACSGRMEVSSISGTLRFLEPFSRFLQAQTTSGDIFLEGDLVPRGTYNFVNHEGSIELVLPADASFELTADSAHGSVSNDFPLTPRTHGRVPLRTHGHSLLGTVQRGGASVRVATFSGTIRIRKR